MLKGEKLTYAAWYLFCDSQPVELQFAVFKGNDKTAFSDFKPPVKGNLFTLLNAAIEYVNDKINWRVEFEKDMKRHEIPEIPVAALREAIVNSFAHRDYNDPKSNEIVFFDDRIEIFNSGTFPEGLTPEDFIKGHERSHLRNPKIAEMFYYTKNIDRWGSGLQRIDKECNEHNVRYEFEVLNNGFLVIFYRPFFNKKSSVKNELKNSEKTLMKLLSEIGIEWSEKWSEKWSRLSKREQQIIILILSDPKMSRAELSDKIGINPSAIQKHIAKLKRKGIIKRIGPAKGGYWKIIENKGEW